MPLLMLHLSPGKCNAHKNHFKTISQTHKKSISISHPEKKGGVGMNYLTHIISLHIFCFGIGTFSPQTLPFSRCAVTSDGPHVGPHNGPRTRRW